MTADRVQRRLAAILSADLVGYSRMMESDETGTLQRLEALRRELVDPTIEAHRGRTVKLMGDGALVEFASAVDAVQCAVAIQEGAVRRNATIEPGLKLEFRIGINLGDVIVRGDDLYGEGVNVAARLEGIAEPGGILIARSVRDQVRDKLDLQLEDLGDVEVKNIARPVRVFRVHATPVDAPAPTQPGAAAPSLSDGTSIVVLPFTNMSGDPEQEYFSDGISEDIITDLSKIPGLLVIARNSAFTFKGKAVNVTEICKQFRVNCALEGSVRKAGQRVRITAQLIDGATGGHLWAERYDRQLTDIFEVQDEVTRQIVTALKLSLKVSETKKPAAIAEKTVTAHDCFLRGRELMISTNLSKTGVAEAMGWFERAIEADPEHAPGYAGLGQVYVLRYQNQWGTDPRDDLQQARRLVDLGLARDPNDPFLHFINSLTAMFEKDYARWQSETDLALALNPNFSLALNVRGSIFFTTDEPLKAVPYIEQAIRLDPAFRQHYLHFLGMAYFFAGQRDKAIALFRERIALNPGTDLSRVYLASGLAHLDQVEEAREVWRQLKEITPGYKAAEHLKRLALKPAYVELVLDGLRKAGLPTD